MKKFSASVLGTITTTAIILSMLPAQFASAMTISPPIFDHVLNPGDTQLDVINLSNEEDTAITLYPTLYNFTGGSDDESGAPQLYPANEDRDNTALAQWMTIDKTPIVVNPGERKNVSFSINIPDKDHATPGGHFGVVIFGTQPPPADGSAPAQVSFATQIGALVLVRVNGDVTEQASIAEFGFKEKKPWYNARPIDMYVRVENSGNTHLRPTGNVFIKNWFGRQVAAPKVNEDFKNVLPHSIRKYEFSWAGSGKKPADGFFDNVAYEWHNFAFGPYTAALYLNYGSSGQILSETRQFTVWPWHLMIVVAVIILLIICIWLPMRRARERAIIRKYERRRQS